MLTSYFQNRDIGMTKDAYLEMCEMLKSEPLESETPVELSDFPYEVRTCFNIYALLRDIWDTMSGQYMGKDYSNIFEYYKMYLIEPTDYLFYTSMLQNIDVARSSLLASKRAASNAANQKKGA